MPRIGNGKEPQSDLAYLAWSIALALAAIVVAVIVVAAVA